MINIQLKVQHKLRFEVLLIIVACSLGSKTYSASVIKPQFKLNFSQSYCTGERYKCHFNAELFKNTRVHNSSAAANRYRSLKINLEGVLTVVEATVAGMIKKLEFKVEKFSGFVDQRKLSSQLKGNIIEVVLALGRPAKISMKNNIMRRLSSREQGVLALVFPSFFEENLADLLGRERKVEIGSKWKPPAGKFLALFKKHRINFTRDKVWLEAELNRREVMNNIDCLVVHEQLKTLNIAGFQFNYNMAIWLPVNLTENCNPRRIQRQAVWRATASLPGNNPLASNHTMSTTVVNTLDCRLVPIK